MMSVGDVQPLRFVIPESSVVKSVLFGIGSRNFNVVTLTLYKYI